MNVLTIAYTTEGVTDVRFLEKIIERTFEQLLMDTSIEIFPLLHIPETGKMVDKILKVAKKADGYSLLCVHVDADNGTDNRAFEERILPAFRAVEQTEGKMCKNLVAIVPVYMTESWMIADTDAFKVEIRTSKSNQELNLPAKSRLAEQIANPKETIKKALQIAYKDYPKRRRRRKISELYTPLVQKVDLEKLALLPSYQKFQQAAKDALIKLNFLQS